MSYHIIFIGLYFKVLVMGSNVNSYSLQYMLSLGLVSARMRCLKLRIGSLLLISM